MEEIAMPRFHGVVVVVHWCIQKCTLAVIFIDLHRPRLCCCICFNTIHTPISFLLLCFHVQVGFEAVILTTPLPAKAAERLALEFHFLGTEIGFSGIIRNSGLSLE